jgi:hypothetical protein
MTGRRNISNLNPKQRGTVKIVRRPFWLPASNYYVLASAVSLAFFFAGWGVMQDEYEETPWIPSGIGASVILGGAVILREVILRKARERYTRIEPGLAQKFSGVHPQFRNRQRNSKLTLEQNATILGEIKQKSNAAKVLGKYSAGHREVFELCGEYIDRIENELKTVNASSPRFSSLLKGRKSASEFHRYHLLQWAEIEAKTLTTEANSQGNISDRINAANNAVGVLEFALESYPAEQTLLDSRDVLREMSVSIKVGDWIEQAERAAFKGDFRDAIGLYRDALFYLGRDNIYTEDRQQAATLINAEIDRLRLLESGE